MTKTRPNLISFFPIPLFFLLIAAFFFEGKTSLVFEPHWLLLITNTLFITVLSLLVACIALTNYRATGQIQILLLGCGLLIFGLGGLVAGGLRNFPQTGANLTVTLHNSAALLSAFFHFSAALILLAGWPTEQNPKQRDFWLFFSYGGLTLVLALLTAASVKGGIPLFFRQGEGPTDLRQWVLGSSMVMFFFSSLVFYGFYLRYRENFLYWYGLALALVAIGLAALLIQNAVGSPIGWVGRFSQYLGGIYFLIAILVARQNARKRRTSLAAVLTASLNPAEEKYRALAENSPDLICRFDRNLRVVYANPSSLRRYPVQNGPLVGRTPEEIHLPESFRRLLTETIETVFETGRTAEFEAYLPAEKKALFYHSQVFPEFGPQGHVANALIVSRDLTERKEVEDALQKNEAAMQSILNATQESIWLLSPEGIVLMGNEIAMKRLGKPAGEIIGANFAGKLSRDLIQSRFKKLREVTHSGKPAEFEDQRNNFFFHHNFYPVFGPEGKVTSVVVFSRDISREKEAEKEMSRLASFPLLNPNPVLEVDLNGRIHFTNPSVESLFPDLRQRGSQHPWLADWTSVVRACEEAGSLIQSREVMVDGRWYLQSVQYIPTLNRIRIYGFDITERKLAEEALQESRQENEFLAGVLQRASQPFAAGYPDGRFGRMNLAFSEMTGYSAAELQSLDWSSHLTPPEWREEEREILQELNRTGSPVRYEKEYLRKDGSRIPIELLVHLSRDEKGNPDYYFSFVTDISERKKAEGLLRRSEARFQLLSDTAGHLLTTDNPQSLVDTLCRKVMAHLDCQAFFNFLAHEPTGRLRLNAYAGIPPEEAEKIAWLDYGVAVCGCVAMIGRPIVAEDIPGTPDVRTELVKSYGIRAYACHPLLGTGGKLIGTLSFGTRHRNTFSDEDLSLMKAVTDQVATAIERMELVGALYQMNQTLDRQVQERTSELLLVNRSLQQEIGHRTQAEEKLKHYAEKLEISNRELQQFAFVASHDLQEPLRKIQTFGSRLESRFNAELDEAARDYLQRIQKAAQRMQDLIRSLLDLSRINARSEPVDRIDLKPLIKGVIEDLEVSLETAGGRIEFGELPILEADPSQMGQLFQNLIGNALKFRGSEPPLVRVFGRPLSPERWQIMVQDNGLGFEEEYAELIFAPFQRLNPRLAYTGAGIGLTICRRIVERHGGTITAQSEPGRGTLFTIILPLKQPKEDLFR